MTMLGWFLEPQFYLIASLYMASKLFVNVAMPYTPLFLQHTLALDGMYIAIIPLIMHITGCVTSITLKFFTDRYGFRSALLLTFSIGIGK